MSKISYNELVLHASGSYLTEELPENWYSMDEEELLDWVESNASGDFELHEPECIMNLIHIDADALRDFLESKGIDITM